MACGCNRKNRGCSFMEWCFEFLCEDDGPVESFCDVGYFYRTTGDISFGPNAAIDFEGADTYGGVTFELTSPSEMKIANTGIYKVSYFAKTQNANGDQIGLRLNGGTVISNTIYATGPDKFVYGQAVIRIDQVNSILQLYAINQIDLDKGSDVEVVASTVVEKVCELTEAND
ncbi:hypothetical protein [Clostridium sp. DL1XJH146]